MLKYSRIAPQIAMARNTEPTIDGVGKIVMTMREALLPRNGPRRQQ